MALITVDQETKALVKVGFFRAADLVMLLGMMFYIVTLAYWWFFTGPDALKIMAAFFGLLIWMSFWIVLLLFRACRFIVEIKAGMAMLPLDSAKALATYFTNGGEGGESVGLGK